VVRRPTIGSVALALALVLAAVHVDAASVVFDGDPVDPGTGAPYEILPGLPLVTPGADGRLGTADDVVHPDVIGDIDLVVRLGAVPPGNAIPGPAPARNAVVTATAGLRGAAVAIPFHVYLSDGAVGAGHPYGNVLAAADMVGLPVVVALFADRNADGFIGPTGKDPKRDVRALAELEPIGTEVALFDGNGRAEGTIVAALGGRPSGGGVTVVATASAFTGAYDPEVLNGAVPTGSGITTAQPFLPERDPARLFTDVGPLDVNGTLNPRPRAAALPDPKSVVPLALSTKSASPTTDVARAVAGPAVCARVVEPPRGRGLPAEPPSLALGTLGAAARLKLLVVAVDRFGNPTDPSPGMTARLTTDAPLAITPDADAAAASESVPLAHAKGEKLVVDATGAGTGTLRVLVGGALCQSLAVSARAERNHGGSDAVVAQRGRADYRSLAAAAAGATDRNGDGRITIVVGDGIFREPVPIMRAVEILGAGHGRSVVDARGLGSALTLGSAGASIDGVTASGGTAGVTVAVPMTVSGLDARANFGAGIELAVDGSVATACVVRANGGAGISLTAAASAVANTAIDNAGAGIAAVTGAGGVAISANVLTQNGHEGIWVQSADAPLVTANAIGGNYGTGIELEETIGGTVTANRAAGNDGEGLRLTQTDGALVDGNDFTANHGFGMRIDRASADFDAAPGTQDPAGTNDVSDNRKGAIEIK
jgi:hypothetical protein